MTKTNMLIGLTMISFIAFVAACGGASTAGSGTDKIADRRTGESLTVTLSSAEGKLQHGNQELMLAFTNGAGKPVDIKAASLNFNMRAMGTMAEMNHAATLTTTGTPGQFKGSVKIAMAGEWIAQITYEGAETGKTTMKVTAY